MRWAGRFHHAAQAGGPPVEPVPDRAERVAGTARAAAICRRPSPRAALDNAPPMTAVVHALPGSVAAGSRTCVARQAQRRSGHDVVHSGGRRRARPPPGRSPRPEPADEARRAGQRILDSGAFDVDGQIGVVASQSTPLRTQARRRRSGRLRCDVTMMIISEPNLQDDQWHSSRHRVAGDEPGHRFEPCPSPPLSTRSADIWPLSPARRPGTTPTCLTEP